FAVFDFAALFPAEDDAFLVHDNELAGNETGVVIFGFGDLAFASERAQVGAPGNRSGRDVFVPGDFHRLKMVILSGDFYDFIEMAGIVSDPFPFELALNCFRYHAETYSERGRGQIGCYTQITTLRRPGGFR